MGSMTAIPEGMSMRGLKWMLDAFYHWNTRQPLRKNWFKDMRREVRDAETVADYVDELSRSSDWEPGDIHG